jgi:uncharacterized repeat protein (TIGR01451 family)
VRTSDGLPGSLARRPLTWALLTVSGLLCFGQQAQAAICAPATSPGAAPADWGTYCWLDFSTYSDTAARAASGQAFTYTLPDGSTLSFTASVTSTSSATALNPVAAPSWSGAPMGNTAFIGIPHKPILYTTAQGSTVNLTFSAITLTPPPGVSGASMYSFVAADGESTNSGESLTFVTNGSNWTVLDQAPPSSGSLYPTVTNTGSTFKETGIVGLVGAYIVGSVNPTQVQSTLQGSGLQGAMFAVRYATISLNKSLAAGRVAPVDQFTYSISATASGTVLATRTSSGTGNGPFNAASSFITTTQSLTLQETMAPGSLSTLAAYTPSLTCTNAASGSSTALPSQLQATSYAIPSISFGDAISCMFTNTRGTSLLAVTKSGPSPGLRVGNNSAYTLSVTNSGSAGTAIAQVKDQLPANLTLVSASGTNWTCGNAGSLVTCNFSGTLAVSGTSTITVTVTPTAAAAGASLTNYASIDPTGGGAAPAPGPACAPAGSCASAGPATVVYINPLPESGTAVAGTASTPIASVVSNDTVNGAPATLGAAGNATVAQSGTWPAGITLNSSSGAINTTPAVPPGSYSLIYKLCDRASPPDCATATDTVTVSASIVATAQAATVPAGTAATAIANVLASDTVNGAAATLGAGGNATLAQSGTWPAGLTLNTSSGAIQTTASLAVGVYTVAYRVCDRNTPANCATANDTVTVSGTIVPGAPTGTATAGIPATPIANIAAGGMVNGAPAALGPSGNATVAILGTWPAGITLSTTTGAVSSSAAAAPGRYSLTFQLCDRNSPPNCGTSTATVTIAAQIVPVAQSGQGVSGTASTPIASIAANDHVNGAPASLGSAGNANVAEVGTWPAGLTLNTSSGAVAIATTVQPGTYTFGYQLCDRSSPPDCATSTATVTIAAQIVALPQSGHGVSGIASTPIASIVANDRVNGAAASLGSSGNATVAAVGTWPAGVVLNTSSGALALAATVQPGSYSLIYRLCDRNSPPDCADATDTLTVTSTAVALAAQGSAIAGAPSTPILNLAAGGSVDGQAATLGPAGNATIAAAGAWPEGISLNPLTGAVTTTASLASGTYPIAYRLCNRSSPPVCATATDTVTVRAAASAQLLIDKSASKTQAEVGDSVQYRLRVRNAGATPAAAVKLTDTLPPGFKLIAGTIQIGLEPTTPKKAPDPQGAPGPSLLWILGNLAPGAVLDLYYQVRLGVGADHGDGINRAQASAANAVSAIATAQVLVIPGSGFDTQACVAGKIYVDCNGNGVQDSGEPGIPGVRLYFEDGTNLTSDENGNYSLCGLRPITHVLKVDKTTLPHGSRLAVISSRNAGDGNSLFVDLRDGELHRADFAEGSCATNILHEVEQRRRQPPLAPEPSGDTAHHGVDFDSASGAATSGPTAPAQPP